jgi:hypothetical protein
MSGCLISACQWVSDFGVRRGNEWVSDFGVSDFGLISAAF